jgi:hypothetical protein
LDAKLTESLKNYCMIVAAVLFLSQAAIAQDSAKPKDRKATLSFEDELVEGTTQKPELFYLFQKKNFNYRRLIKLRENFLPEMRKTAEDVQRVRGGS